ncbi:MAG: SatD family protein [Tenericutes bacterium]|nr:SatD family protein [Mycoplasmatota bacterium]
MYYTLIGDLKKSKTINNRIEVQHRLRDVLNEMNLEYQDVLVKKMYITLGDEFQGVFHSFESIFEIMHKIMFSLDPVELRFGLGIGDILFDESKNASPYDSDGEAWWFARDAIKAIKDLEEKQKVTEFSNIMIKTKDSAFDLMVNKVFDLLYIIKTGWTDTQQKMIEVILNHFGLTRQFKQIDLAKLLDEAPPTVNEKLKRTKYYEYVEMIEALSLFIKQREG